MVRMTVVVAVLGVLAALTCLGICCKEKQTPPSRTDGDNGAPDGSVKKMLGQWAAGDKDTAVAEFLGLRWTAAEMEGEDLLLMTDKEFKSREDWQALRSRVWKEYVDPLREMCRYVLAEGDKAADAGNAGRARKCYQALQRSASFMLEDERLDVLKAIGRGVAKRASERMSKLSPES